MKKLIAGVLCLITITVSAQTVSKKVNLPKGEQHEQLSKVDMMITQEMMGQTMEIKMVSDITSLLEFKDAAASSFTVANTVKRVLMNMTAGGQEVKFDSDKKEDLDGEIGKGYKDQIGKTREYTLNKDGVITEVKGDTSTDKMSDNMFGSLMSGAAQGEKKGQNFNALANLPGGNVKVGDTWTDSSAADGSKAITKYTLKQVNGSDGVVSMTGDLKISREIEQQGMTMQMDMSGITSGEYTFDVATGLIKSRKATTKANGTVDVMGQTIPMTLETTVTSTVNKK